jgi:hypothetical protein
LFSVSFSQQISKFQIKQGKKPIEVKSAIQPTKHTHTEQKTINKNKQKERKETIDAAAKGGITIPGT